MKQFGISFMAPACRPEAPPEPLTGLIIAAVLMHPEKKIKAIDVEFIKRRYKEKSFAKGARREDIETCRNLGLELDEFIAVCLKAMQGIDADLGL